MTRTFLILLLFSGIAAQGQLPSHDQMLLLAATRTGVYVTHEQFVRNNPVPLGHIQGDGGFADMKYLFSLKKGDPIIYHDRYGIRKNISSADIWGFCTGESIYVNAGIGYSKLEIIGSISYFIADILVERPEAAAGMSSGAAGFSSQTQYSYERQAVLLDAVSGIMAESSPRNLEKMIAADSTLYTQYSSLRNKDQQKQIIQTINEYNLRHPFIFKK